MIVPLASVIWMLREAWNDLYRLSFVITALVYSISELFFWHNLGLGLLLVTWCLYAAAEQNASS